MLKNKFLSIVIMALSPLFLQAQHAGDVHMLDMSNTLPFVIAFYFVTFISLSLLMLKLLRPKFPTYWLYISCIVGIAGAAIVTLSFDEIQNKQLPKIENSEVEEEKLSPQMKEQLHIHKRDVENQKYANFWIISIPNIIILGLGIFSDLNNKKRDTTKPRGRYD